jgi:hypothetical protein
MNQFQRRSLASHSRNTAACEAISSKNGAAGSGASTGCVPTRRMAAGVMPEYPSAPAGQIASPMRSCTEPVVPE